MYIRETKASTKNIWKSSINNNSGDKDEVIKIRELIQEKTEKEGKKNI